MIEAAIVEGYLSGSRSIELDEDVDHVPGPVLVLIRKEREKRSGQDILDVPRLFPPGSRTMEDIVRQIRQDRASWSEA